MTVSNDHYKRLLHMTITQLHYTWTVQMTFTYNHCTCPLTCPSYTSITIIGTPIKHNQYTCLWQIHIVLFPAFFGKYLNEYRGQHTPVGWRRWVGLIKNSRFYNYSVVDETGRITRHEDNYYKDYLTDLVANDSCSFLQESKKTDPDKWVDFGI